MILAARTDDDSNPLRPATRMEFIIDRVLKVGIASAVGVYLIWFVTDKLDRKVDAMIEHMAAQMKIDTVSHESVKQTLYSIDYWQRRQTEVALANCINNSKGSGEALTRCQSTTK